MPPVPSGAGQRQHTFVIRDPLTLRIANGASVVALAAVCGYIGVTGFLLGWPVAVLSLSALPSSFRSRIEVRPRDDEVISFTAWTRTMLRASSIENVRVPPWGPLCITLRAGSGSTRELSLPLVHGWSFGVQNGEGARRANIKTSVSGKTGQGTSAHELAGVLGVPVVSVWPGTATGDDRWQWDTSVRPAWLLKAFLAVLVVLAGGVLLLVQVGAG